MRCIKEILRTAPVIPVLVIDRIEDAIPLANALVAGGLPVLEITLRTATALAAIQLISKHVPEAIVGVGTVTRAEQFAQAKAHGAKFAVSPGFNQDLIRAAQSSDIPFLPGVMTPSDVIQAQAEGFNVLKFFPAQVAGGIAMLKALAGPFPDVVFCPTGGITHETAAAFLALKNVICIGGSWMVPTIDVNAARWSDITKLALETQALRPTA